MTELEAAGWKKAEEKTADQVKGYDFVSVYKIFSSGDRCGHQVHIQLSRH